MDKETSESYPFKKLQREVLSFFFLLQDPLHSQSFSLFFVKDFLQFHLNSYNVKDEFGLKTVVG